MKRGQPSHTISGVFVFLLLGIFAVFSTVMVLLGARTYKTTSERTQAHNEGRVAAAYVRSMVRADDETGVITLEDLDGISTVTMRYVYDDEAYLTRLFVYDGSLRELFAAEEYEFDPEQGEIVCPLDSMTARVQDGLLTISLTAEGRQTDVDIALRCAAER